MTETIKTLAAANGDYFSPRWSGDPSRWILAAADALMGASVRRQGSNWQTLVEATARVGG